MARRPTRRTNLHGRDVFRKRDVVQLAMVLRKCYRYRFYPTPTQQEHLIRILGHCQELYNAALYQRREAYRVCGINVTYGMQQNELPALKEEQPRFREVGSQALQDVLCGRPVPTTLSDRWHTCPYEDCGLSLQRDHNAARNILNRAGLARAGV